jgi:hypothetical protein
MAGVDSSVLDKYKPFKSTALQARRLRREEGMKNRAQKYDELRQQSKAQKDENILAHKARTARIRRGTARQARLSPRAKGAQTPLDFLAIGDSWFEYPLYDSQRPSSRENPE